MTLQETYADVEPGTLGEPLCRMSIDYRDKMPEIIPARIIGCWCRVDDTFHFSIQTPSSWGKVDMRVLTGDAAMERKMPIRA